MTKYLLIAASMLFLLCQCSNNSEDPENVPPNVIIIMADDLGYNDLGCYGSAVAITPHIDRLAESGIRFTDYHSNGTVCSPTRAALMTGRYQQRSGIGAVVTALSHRHTGLDSKEVTMADYFKKQDYNTGIVGKWHLGYDTLYSPLNNGFDYFNGFVSGNIDYHSHIDQTGHYDWWVNKDTVVQEGYSTDLFTRSSIDFIDKNANQPFFLYVAHESPHYPYQGRSDMGERTINGEFQVQGSRKDRKVAYQEMIGAMDEGIGDIIQHLRGLDLLSNTLILFISDNGATQVGSNSPLNGFKGSMWEGGHRVPAIAYWEGKIKPGTNDETLLSMDIFPTLIELVGSPDTTKVELDGESFLSHLVYEENKKDHAVKQQDRWLFWEYKSRKAVRHGDWKLIVDPEERLFNLREDIGEQSNLVEQFPAKRDSLYSALSKWELEMSTYIPRTN